MANRGYDVVVDVDQEVRLKYRVSSYTDDPQGDLGHTDLQEDLEFHSSSKPTPSTLKLPNHLYTRRLRKHVQHA